MRLRHFGHHAWVFMRSAKKGKQTTVLKLEHDTDTERVRKRESVTYNPTSNIMMSAPKNNDDVNVLVVGD